LTAVSSGLGFSPFLVLSPSLPWTFSRRAFKRRSLAFCAASSATDLTGRTFSSFFGSVESLAAGSGGAVRADFGAAAAAAAAAAATALAMGLGGFAEEGPPRPPVRSRGRFSGGSGSLSLMEGIVYSSKWILTCSLSSPYSFQSSTST
jgi:hypothetical protein